MALNRRGFLLVMPLGAGAVAGCISSARRTGAGAALDSAGASVGAGAGGYQELAVAPGPGGPEAKMTVLVAMPETIQTKEVWTGLTDELGREFRLVAIRAEGERAAGAIEEGIRRHRPVGVVLMNNPTVGAYLSLQRQAGPARSALPFPPAVIVMTSFLEGHPLQIASATGISYEVPLITVVTNLRKVIASPVERVGVILRGPQQSFVRRQAELARREQITVIEQQVSARPNASEVKWALRRIKHQVDAIWILNDDQLLSPRLIADGWLPGLNERPFRPTIVGAASLVSPAQSFGTFAVLPDHVALGVQAANMMFDIADRNWSVPEGAAVELPLSTTTTVDLVQVRQRFSLRRAGLQQVDRILE